METLEHSIDSQEVAAEETEQPLPNLRSTLIEALEALRLGNETHPVIDELAQAFAQLPEDEPDLIQRYETIRQAFDLNIYELKVLLLCLARECFPSSATLFATYHGSTEHNQPSFRFCQELLTGTDLAASAPTSPLRLWRLIEVDKQKTLAESSLRLDERILHFLYGIDTFDSRLIPYFEKIDFKRLPSEDALPYSTKVLEVWQQAGGFINFPLCRLLAAEPEPSLEVVNSICQQTGLQAYTLRPIALPSEAYERAALAQLWQREALLGQCILYVDTISHHPMSEHDKVWIQQIQGPTLVAIKRSESTSSPRPSISFNLAPPDSQSRFECVRRHLNQFGIEADPDTQAICRFFELGEAAISRATSQALTESHDNSLPFHQHLRIAFKEESRRGLGHLTQCIQTHRGWPHLILPEKQLELLRQVARQAQHRPQVYQDWGFGPQNPNGLGITVLLSGPSGTGKTLAAEVLAHELELDLFRIDLSAVVSKYIGETEENLRQVFDAAESGGAVLLFDEADSLFGNRSEVKDSHDRHANIEVSYLLQRMESYRGIALLTTNFKQAIDNAFLRRLRFVVDFPYPDNALRIQLWQGAFPPEAPLGDLNYEALSKLSLSGGNIRNIVLNAAFHAADSDQPIGMRHLQQAVRHELSKLERPIPESEIKALLR